MSFSIHLDNNSIEQLLRLAKKTGKTRNALIREAVERLLHDEACVAWPKAVEQLAGAMPDLTPFEANRAELLPLKDDPFA